MTFVDHLIELRSKLIKMLVAVVVIFLMFIPFASEIYTIIAEPLVVALLQHSGTQMIATGVIAPFLTPLKTALILSIYCAMPYLLYQIWSFIAPGLYKHEKQFITPLVISSTLLFYLGIIFAFFVVLPLTFNFLAQAGPNVVSFMPDINNYLDFIIKISFAFGIAFEVPVAIILCLMFRITTIDKVKKNRPYIIIGAFVIGMLITPPDVISQTLIAVPMLLLFELGLLLSPFFIKLKETEDK